MSDLPGTLILVRHGQSAHNRHNIFTGWLDPDLTDKGRQEARDAGRTLAARRLIPQSCFSSTLGRATQTLDLMLEEMGPADRIIVHDQALNERNYGELSGLNRDDAGAIWGREQVRLWRRSYDGQPPGGESLRQTAERVLPYFETRIEPIVRSGQTVLIVGHSNSLRALVKRLENLDEAAIATRELVTGVPQAYRVDVGGHVELCPPL